jgi:hypothetical protein
VTDVNLVHAKLSSPGKQQRSSHGLVSMNAIALANNYVLIVYDVPGIALIRLARFLKEI